MFLATYTGDVLQLDPDNGFMVVREQHVEDANLQWILADEEVVLSSAVENHIVSMADGSVGGFSGHWPNDPIVGGDHVWLPGVEQVGVIERTVLAGLIDQG